ncbi:MAG: hypothetical protein FH758_05240 [Firmicutes bacterium]|nr:hypothetical protein [Bacillota bacterium]
MKLSHAIELLKTAGVKAQPVPGTSKYNITLPDGEMRMINEKQLVALVNKAEKSPTNLLKVIETAV